LSDRLQTLLDRLPQHFAKDKNSNNYKLLKIIAQGSEDNRLILQTIQKFWDVDTSEGIGLDRLGKDEGISRGSWDDETYRKMIKIQYILNRSESDIATMNQILDSYMEKGFIGLQDGWMEFEPASLILNINEQATNVPKELLKKIKPAGVRIYTVLNSIVGTILLIQDHYEYPVFYKETGEFSGEKNFFQHEIGAVNTDDDSYDYEIEYPVFEKFVTIADGEKSELTNDTYTYPKRFYAAGELATLTKRTSQQTATSNIQQDCYNYIKSFLVCGEFYAEAE